MIVYVIIALIFLLIYLNLVRTGRMNLFELTALTFIIFGGILMIWSKTWLGNVGVGIFSLGSFMQLVDVIKNKNEIKR
ncbi:hypothetical protein [Falsibacillus albus]|uniref:Uncharacterized protein n=1 Tax=Falsibacillus albus TaxID=2478915 RepID=A0A3L7JVE8_9BACI|nr:hypothetical protein [Falsibacillus albus]RLQ94510.1 hypothetical protein D9X91_13275 [Falsibacillus albus]